MSFRVSIRVSEDFRDLLRQEIKRRNCTQRELVVKAVQYYADQPLVERSTQPDRTQPGLKPIVTRYSGSCYKCGTPIPVGSQAWYGKARHGEDKQKRGMLVCPDCMVLGMGDKTLAKKYIKVRELQATIRGLRKEADELTEKLFDPNLFKRTEKFQTTVLGAIDQYKRYLSGAPEEEREHLETFLNVLREAARIGKGLDDFLYFQMRRLKKSKKTLPAV